MLIQLIEKLGTKFANHIDGMFAIALFDVASRTVHLFRDTSGQKNLYYSIRSNTIYFASEIEALFSLSNRIQKSLNINALNLSSHVGYFPTQSTLFGNVFKLMPGQHLKFSALSGTQEFMRVTTKFDANKIDFSARIRSLAPSSTGIAVNLSGGLDSTIVLHELSKIATSIKTYTTSYIDAPTNSNSEAVYAKELASIYGTKHTELEYSVKNYVDDFIDAYSCLDEPNYNSSVPLYYALAKFQGINGQGERVVFTGDGGDEIAFGYSHYKKSIDIDRLLKIMPRKMLTYWFEKLKGKKIRFEDPVHRWLYFKSWQPAFHSLMHSIIENADFIQQDLRTIKYDFQLSDWGNCHSTMKLDRLFWLANEAFVRSDKIYMSQSVEVRFPLALPSLVTDADCKISSSKNLKALLGKTTLRDQYRGQIPDFIVNRRDKVGWSPPVDAWYNLGLRDRVLDLLPKGDTGLVLWGQLRSQVEQSTSWPGKTIFWYISLAAIARKYNLSI